MTMPSVPVDGTPLDPSSPEARRWVLDELSKGRYTTEPSWWQRFVEWLQDLLGSGPGSGAIPAWVAAAVVAAVLAAIALVVVRVVRREPSTRGGPARGAVVDEEGLAATDYRARARQAATRRDWDAVLLDSYRALAASAVERTLLTDLPGRTAHEVAVALGPVFPDQAPRLAASATEFDAVRYGHRRTTEALATAAADLDATLLSTRPRLDQLVGP